MRALRDPDDSAQPPPCSTDKLGMTTDTSPNALVHSLRALLAVAPLALLPLACGEPATPKPPVVSQPTMLFPRRDDLARLPSLPAPRGVFAADAIAAELWTFVAPVAMQDDESRYEDASPWGAMARDFVAAHKTTLRLSPSLRCAASELARFHVQRGGQPTESLRRFTIARCGGAAPDATPLVYSGEAPETMTDQVIFDQAKAGVLAMLEKSVATGRRAFGLGTARQGKRIAIVAVEGSDDVALEATPRSIDGSRRVQLRGVVRVPAAEVGAAINRGDFGVSTCDSDKTVVAPHFAFSCRLDDTDKSAWVELRVRRQGRFLEQAVANLLVYEGDPAAMEYRAKPSGPAMSIADAAAFTPALLSALNRVRAAGKLAPLALAPKQSAENARLAGTLLDAIVGDRGEDADRITLGLLAGWEVGGLVRNGSFFIGHVAPSRDVVAWLDFALERPMGRGVLLDPMARQVAIGPAIPDGVQGLAAAVSTYQTFDGVDHDADAARVLARVNEVREANGRPALARAQSPELREQAALVLDGKREPMLALDTAIHAAAQRSRTSVGGFVVESNDLEHAPLPESVLRAAGGTLSVEVTHHRAEGAAWGQYVVLYMLVQ